jgi:hypothetical protein
LKMKKKKEMIFLYDGKKMSEIWIKPLPWGKKWGTGELNPPMHLGNRDMVSLINRSNTSVTVRGTETHISSLSVTRVMANRPLWVPSHNTPLKSMLRGGSSTSTQRMLTQK